MLYWQIRTQVTSEEAVSGLIVAPRVAGISAAVCFTSYEAGFDRNAVTLRNALQSL